jgi:ATP/maltotriose-dependent transcriptional regulator MalT
MRDPLDRRQRVRGEKDCPALRGNLREQRVEALLYQRVEPGDRLVEDQQLGLVHERLDEPELLAVAGRELAHRAIDLGIEALDQPIADTPVHAAAQAGEMVQHLRAAELRVEREVAGQESDAAADLQAAGMAVEAEQCRRARRRPDQVQQQPHRRRLARTIWSQEAEDLTTAHLEVEVEETVPPPIVLGQANRADRRPVAHGTYCFTVAITITSEVVLSVPTVRSHLQTAYQKLGVSDRAATVAEAPRRGLID